MVTLCLTPSNFCQKWYIRIIYSNFEPGGWKIESKSHVTGYEKKEIPKYGFSEFIFVMITESRQKMITS